MTKSAIDEIVNSEWEYSEIESNLLDHIGNNHHEECLEIIKKYDSVIEKHFESNSNIKQFVDKLNDVLLRISKSNNFTAVNVVLTHKLFEKVLATFNESDILIKAFKGNNFYTIRRVINDICLNINYCSYDENGYTALMLAAEHWKNVFAVESILNRNRDSLFIVDKNGNTALYHSIHNINIFNRILFVTKDINHINNNNESIILYCGRKEAFISFSSVCSIPNINLKVKECIFIEEGKREFPKIVESNNDKLLKYVALQYQAISSACDTDILKRIVDEVGNTLMIILIKKYYEAFMSGDKKAITSCIRMLKVLVFYLECDINGVIDEEGNTPLIFFLLIEDYSSANYLLSCKNIDLSVKNKHGISPSYLSIFIGDEEKKLRMKLLEHPTFDNFYRDSGKDNLITHFIVRNYYDEALQVLSKAKYLLTVPNEKGETTMIIAIKSGHSDILQEGFFQNEGMNQQDSLGNTALHYAVQLKDKYALINLAYYGADTTIKNNEGLTALELAEEAKDEELLSILNNPMESLKKKSSAGPKLMKMFSKLNESSLNDASSSSSSSIDSDPSEGNKEFNKALQKNKKHFIRPKDLNECYKEDYEYLFKKYKTVYSNSSNDKAFFKNINDIYILAKTWSINYVPMEWALYLTLSAICYGTVMNENKRIDTTRGAQYYRNIRDIRRDGNYNFNDLKYSVQQVLYVIHNENYSIVYSTKYRDCDGKCDLY